MKLSHEIIIDNFAGGGGASTGIELATGRSVDVAINHDPAAIAMHKVNHPETEHYCESVWDINPREVANGRDVALCWLSPDCKHFSKAKGGKPVEKGIRGLAWVAVRWAATVRPRVIVLENVEEFKTWGPVLDTGYPDPKNISREFNAFVNALKRQGYKVEHRELKACDYGAPTIRKRFFMIARCDDQPITWPKPTHFEKGKPKWVPASTAIDWTDLGKSIFERKKELVENTKRRIARGYHKFILNSPKPYIAPVTITTNNHQGLVSAFLAQYHTETAGHEVRGQPLDQPLYTLDTSNRYALVTGFLAKNYGGNYNGPGADLEDPVPTITTKDHNSLVLAFLVAYYGASVGHSLNDPLGTVTTHDRFGLVTVHGQDYRTVDIRMRMLKPIELFKAQGFPKDYIIDRDHTGKKYPTTEQVARCGNSVPPPFAKAIVQSNLPELCSDIPYKTDHQLQLQLV